MINSRETLRLFCICLGLWVIVSGVAQAAWFYQSLSAVLKGNRISVHLGGLTVPPAKIILGCLLIVLARPVSSSFFASGSTFPLNVPDGWQSRVFVLCMRLAGLIVLVGGLSDLAGAAFGLAWDFQSVVRDPTRLFDKLMPAATQVGLGAYLLWGGRLLLRTVNFAVGR